MAATSLTRSLVFVSFIFHILQPAFLSSSFREHSISLKYRIIVLRRYMIYGHEIEWKATADLGRFLSLELGAWNLYSQIAGLTLGNIK